MKKYSMVMLLALGLVGCSEKIVPQEDIEEVSGKVVTLYADASEVTRTSYEGDKTFSWTAGDEISVLYHDSSDNPIWVTFTATSTAPSSAFTATVDDDYTLGAPSTGTQWALYPANANHIYTDDSTIGFSQPEIVDGSSAKIAMIATVASGSSDSYHFRQLGGALKFTIKNIRTEASRIRVFFDTEGSSEKFLSGVFAVQNPSSDAPSIEHNIMTSEGKHYISATADVDGSHNAVVYMPMPNSLSAWPWYTVNVYDADNGALLCNKHVGTGSPVTATRRKINVVNDLTIPTVDRSEKIQIDGYFDDWSTAEGVVEKSYTSGGVPIDMKLASDGNKIWFYHKIDGSKINLAKSGYMWIYVDRDNNSATGGDQWYASGCDLRFEYYFSSSDKGVRSSMQYLDCNVCSYDEGTSKWSWGSGSFDASTVAWSGFQNASNDMFIEWSTTLSNLGISAGSTIRVGYLGYSPEFHCGNKLLSLTIPTL